VQLVGKDSLSEDQKAVLKTASIIKDEFLQQNSFSKTDYNCPMYKTMGMMKAIVKFHENCIRVLEATARSEKKISMAFIEAQLGNDIIYELTQMKFQIPTRPEQEIRTYFDSLHENIDKKFTDLQYSKV